MKMVSLSAAAWLLVVLLCRIQPSTATEGTGSLAFLTLSSPTTVFGFDDGYRDVYVNNGFKFGTTTISNVRVSINGYISMGTNSSIVSPSIPGDSNIVSPYGADIDTTVTGTVRYMPFTSSNSQISTVSAFIRSQTGNSFYGTRMMVVEWDRVPKYRGSSSTTSTFQAVLITDGSDSYAVFIYDCGGMEWSGATIGWAYSSSVYEEHFLSGNSSAGIGCEYSFSHSAIIYLLWNQGSLAFLTLSSPATVLGIYSSPPIHTSSGFKFGTGTVYSVYVSTNGYISMGTTPSYNFPTIPGTSNIVSPYGAYIDTTVAGTVRYTQFTTSNSQISTVNSFIWSQTGNSFYGTRMMVAEWAGVPKYRGSGFITSTFQAVLITDGSDSYAVFIYDCGGMEWSGATIGWVYSSSVYEEHYLSGNSSASIGCRYSSSYSAIIYKLNPCSSYLFTCDNGQCESQSDVCDGYNDCGDNSDEQNCATTSTPYYTGSYGCSSYNFTCDNGHCIDEYDECDNYDDCGDNSDEENCVNVGLAVGLSVGLLVGLLLFFGSPICIGVIIYCRAVRSSDPSSIPPGYPQQPAPVAGYPFQPQPQSGYLTSAPYPTQAYPPPIQYPAPLS